MQPGNVDEYIYIYIYIFDLLYQTYKGMHRARGNMQTWMAKFDEFGATGGRRAHVTT